MSFRLSMAHHFWFFLQKFKWVFYIVGGLQTSTERGSRHNAIKLSLFEETFSLVASCTMSQDGWQPLRFRITALERVLACFVFLRRCHGINRHIHLRLWKELVLEWAVLHLKTCKRGLFLCPVIDRLWQKWWMNSEQGWSLVLSTFIFKHKLLKSHVLEKKFLLPSPFSRVGPKDSLGIAPWLLCLTVSSCIQPDTRLSEVVFFLSTENQA